MKTLIVIGLISLSTGAFAARESTVSDVNQQRREILSEKEAAKEKKDEICQSKCQEDKLECCEHADHSEC